MNNSKMINKSNALISVDRIYKVTGEQLYAFNKSQVHIEHTFKHLPKWSINTNGESNNLMTCHDWFWFISSMADDKQEYYIFDLSTSDLVLNEEISNSDWERFDVDWLKIVENIGSVDFKWFLNYRIPNARYLTCETTYYSSVHPEYGEELDYITFDITGYLDNNFNKIDYEKK